MKEAATPEKDSVVDFGGSSLAHLTQSLTYPHSRLNAKRLGADDSSVGEEFFEKTLQLLLLSLAHALLFAVSELCQTRRRGCTSRKGGGAAWGDGWGNENFERKRSVGLAARGGVQQRRWSCGYQRAYPRAAERKLDLKGGNSRKKERISRSLCEGTGSRINIQIQTQQSQIPSGDAHCRWLLGTGV